MKLRTISFFFLLCSVAHNGAEEVPQDLNIESSSNVFDTSGSFNWLSGAPNYVSLSCSRSSSMTFFAIFVIMFFVNFRYKIQMLKLIRIYKPVHLTLIRNLIHSALKKVTVVVANIAKKAQKGVGKAKKDVTSTNTKMYQAKLTTMIITMIKEATRMSIITTGTILMEHLKHQVIGNLIFKQYLSFT